MSSNKKKKSKEELAQEFGFAYAIIKSNPNLTSLFNEAWAALSGGKAWSQEKFTARLTSTDWFKNRSNQQRLYYKLKNDPSQKIEFQKQLSAAKSTLNGAAKSLGAILDPATLTMLADENLMNGWNQAQTTEILTAYIDYKKDPVNGVKTLTGTAGNIEDDIRKFANSMGVSVTDDWVLKQAKVGVKSGIKDTTFAEDWIRARAKEKYSAYANDLDNSTMEDLSYNFRQSMANLLELDSVSLNDSTVQKALQAGDGKGNKMTLTDFEKSLRKDSRWYKTNNAKESAQSVVNDLLSSFGLM